MPALMKYFKCHVSNYSTVRGSYSKGTLHAMSTTKAVLSGPHSLRHNNAQAMPTTIHYFNDRYVHVHKSDTILIILNKLIDDIRLHLMSVCVSLICRRNNYYHQQQHFTWDWVNYNNRVQQNIKHTCIKTQWLTARWVKNFYVK